jgi:predicted metal-dependent peptidase
MNINKLEEVFKNLILDSTLYGDVLVKLNRRFDDELTKTISVLFEGRKPTIIVNKEYFFSFKMEQRKALIVHEMQHLICRHDVRLIQCNDKTLIKIANLAMDCAINQFNKFKLPFDHVKLGDISKIVKKELEPNREFEYYYKEMVAVPKCHDELLSYYKKNGKDHEYLIEQDMVNESTMNEIVNSALEREKNRLLVGEEKGNSILNIIPQKVKIEKAFWKKLVDDVLGIDEISNENFEYIYGKQNRRDVKNLYGKKRLIEDRKCYVVIDTSASITKEVLIEFISHLNKAMRSENLNLTLIQCDKIVTKIQTNQTRIKKNGIEIKGGGGTDLRQATKKINEMENGRKTNALILTDGYTEWEDYSNISFAVIYTKKHQKLPIKKEAILTL